MDTGTRYTIEQPRFDTGEPGGGGGGGGGDDGGDSGGDDTDSGTDDTVDDPDRTDDSSPGYNEPDDDDDDGGSSGGGSSGGGGSTTDPFNASDVNVILCRGLPDEASPEATVSIDVNVENDNSQACEGRIVVEDGNTRFGTERFSLAAGAAQDISVDLNLPSTPGDYEPEASVDSVTEGVSGL